MNNAALTLDQRFLNAASGIPLLNHTTAVWSTLRKIKHKATYPQHCVVFPQPSFNIYLNRVSTMSFTTQGSSARLPLLSPTHSPQQPRYLEIAASSPTETNLAPPNLTRWWWINPKVYFFPGVILQLPERPPSHLLIPTILLDAPYFSSSRSLQPVFSLSGWHVAIHYSLISLFLICLSSLIHLSSSLPFLFHTLNTTNQFSSFPFFHSLIAHE